MRAWWLLLIVGCGKQLNPEFCAAHPDDSRCVAADSMLGGDGSNKLDVAHLAPAVEMMLTSTATVNIVTATTIDTSMGTVMPNIAGAVVLASVTQESGPEVMVIQAANLTLGAVVTVTGSRPLIFVATQDMSINMNVDGAADMGRPGPGGSQQTQGQGAGAAGAGGNGLADSGGGGGGFGTAGGTGGDCDQHAGGIGGTAYGSAASLVGGSGGARGGAPLSCPSSGGAGGGALQFTAGGTLAIGGAITVGGGGAGPASGCSSDGAAGSGGGAGGMIFVQARTFTGTGMLGANGGGGSGGASSGGGTPSNRGDNATVSAGGQGGSGGSSGGRGGNGATGANPGLDGVTNTSTDQNGGGGGGGAGRIYYKGPSPTYQSSPPATSA
jgi:hypothetical protein